MKILSILVCLVSFLYGASFIPDSTTVRSMGRVAYTSSGISYDWCGTRFDFSFTGTSLALRFEDLGNQYDLTIDYISYPKIITGRGDSLYRITADLKPGTHRVTIERRTEKTWGIATFKEIILDETGELAPAPTRPARRLLTLGDSFTAGYGVEHDSREGSTEDYVNTSNTAKAFGSLVGKSFEADYTTLGFSGKGMIRNAYGDSHGKEFPAYYDLLFASDLNLNLKILRPWNHQSWKPQIIVINLGINDFSGTEAAPADSFAWINRYEDFIDLLVKQFENPAIIVCATTVWPNDYLKPSAQTVVNRAKAKGQRVYLYNYSTENSALHWHPSVAEQQKIADGIVALINQEKLWETVNLTGNNYHPSSVITIGAAGSGVTISGSTIPAGILTVAKLNGEIIIRKSIEESRGMVQIPLFRTGTFPVVVTFEEGNRRMMVQKLFVQ